MIYRFYQQGRDTSATLCITERHSRTSVTYYPKRRIQELYPDGNYQVIGEIGNFAKACGEEDVVVTHTGKHIPIFPLGSLKKPFEWVTGYAAVGEDIYVRVIKSVIPQL